ncbi:phosphopantetheine-binding protein [Cystobacter fuscus]
MDPAWSSIPYGVAMPNQAMYVLDNQLRHCPTGVTGEIYIGGMGVALNYWRAPDLSKARFLEHPRLGRLYKTGDQGRWSRSGYIEFLGRNDFQVKLNGYRVELEEIAAKLCQLPGVDNAVVRIQKAQGRDHVVAYLVPTADKDAPVERVDPNLFVLAGHGLLNDARARYALPVSLDAEAWCQRKSYRQFLETRLEPTLVEQVLDAALGAPQPALTLVHRELDRETLGALFSPLAAMQLGNRALPKYRYPSAGGAYPVRAWLKLGGTTGDMQPGQYYFHPLRHQLCAAAETPAGLFEGDAPHQLALSIHWPAITPLYGTQSRRLALIELGHILQLLSDVLNQRHIAHRVVLMEQALDADNSLVCRILLGEGDSGFKPVPLSVSCFRKTEDGRGYAEVRGDRRFALLGGVLPGKISDAYAILGKAQYALALEGDERLETLVSAGYLTQRLGDALHARQVGSCALGVKPTERCLYTVALGPIDPGVLGQTDSPLEREEPRRAINRELSNSLPDYMLPDFYHVLESLPLTPNGKLAADRLPSIDFNVTRVAPKNALETTLMGIWQKALGIPESAISTDRSFFSLGGNSLSAMRLVRALHVELGLTIKLKDIYQHNTIIALAQAFGRETEVTAREEGEL